MLPIVSTIATGMTMGYSAVLLPQLWRINATGISSMNVTRLKRSLATGSDDPTITSTHEESWIAASAAIAMVPGCWISTLLMDKLGRKSAFMIINPIFALGWNILAFANEFTMLIVGRVLCGFSVGLLGATSPVYILEITHPHLRGLLLACLSLAVALGILSSHVLGTWLHWRLTAHLCGLIPILCFIFGYFVPETPSWLLKHDSQVAAFNTWQFLKGKDSSMEFANLNSDIHCNHNDEEKSWRELYLVKPFLMPLFIICVFAFTSQFSGINVVTFYCVKMLTDIVGTDNAYLATMLLDCVRVIFSIVACWLTKRCSRRLLTNISGFGTALTLFALSACLYSDYDQPWLSIVFLFIYICTVSLGLVPLPWLLCAELFPDASTRALGSGLSAGFAFICFFGAVKTGPIALEVILPHGTFTVYGTIALLGTVFLHFCLPETKDKTSDDIKNEFMGINTDVAPKKVDRY
ncbi:hypothetical protein PV326_005462 [Microctonus aethiopoides]|nr:hypothetical protein PV326_005462 [Microctonus aethiopoides]